MLCARMHLSLCVYVYPGQGEYSVLWITRSPVRNRFGPVYGEDRVIQSTLYVESTWHPSSTMVVHAMIDRVRARVACLPTALHLWQWGTNDVCWCSLRHSTHALRSSTLHGLCSPSCATPSYLRRTRPSNCWYVGGQLIPKTSLRSVW
jgi:hypothetical protein